jgi:nucleotide-binding universal stress UspA family protein
MDHISSDTYKWNVACDGSDNSEIAFDITLNNLMKEEDYIIVSHVFQSHKDYLSYKLKPENIKQDAEAKLSGRHSSTWTSIWEHREKDLSTKEHIMQIAKSSHTDCLVLGFVGRKGPKEDPTLLGSAVEYMAHNPVCPCLIIKDDEQRSAKENGAYRWLVCSDGSEKSYNSLRETIRIIDKSKDEIVILVVEISNVHVKDIEKETSKILEEADVKHHKFETIERDSDEKTFEAIVDYVNVDDTPYIDFVTVANQGSGYKSHSEKKYFGKVAKGVLIGAKANIFLVF